MRTIKKMIKKFLYYINEKKYKKENMDTKNDKINELKTVIEKEAKFKNVISIDVKNSYKNKFKWVGAVNYNNNMYCIANGINVILKINLENNKIDYLEFNYKEKEEFSWTGGCKYNNKIYGFPRTSNKLLCIDVYDDSVSLIDLNLNYNSEHHYGGVCTKEGIIYQPPRCGNSILVINLNDFSTHRIMIGHKFLKYRYLSGIQHTNGLIYFFPEKDEKVLVLNPETEKFYFIGNRIDCMVFDAAIGEDNNIYGFSGYEKGILKINTKEQTAKMICKEIGIPGCYGSKLGINGKIYGIVGNGNYFWEFDVEMQTAQKVFSIDENIPAKCAGGIIAQNGDIYSVPAFGNKIYIMQFDNKKKLTDEQLESIYFCDNY